VNCKLGLNNVSFIQPVPLLIHALPGVPPFIKSVKPSPFKSISLNPVSFIPSASTK